MQSQIWSRHVNAVGEIGDPLSTAHQVRAGELAVEGRVGHVLTNLHAKMYCLGLVAATVILIPVVVVVNCYGITYSLLFRYGS